MALPQLLRDEPVRRHPLAGLRRLDRAVWGELTPTAGDRLSRSVARALRVATATVTPDCPPSST